MLLKAANRSFLVILLLPFCASPVFAEKIYLKSGKMIEGKIEKKTDQSVVVDVGGVPSFYNMDLVEKIDDSGAGSPSAPGVNPAAAAEELRVKPKEYVDPVTGLSIVPPRGWKEMPSSSDGGNVAIGWSESGQNEIPSLMVQSGELPPGIDTAKQYAKDITAPFHQHKNASVVEEPHDVIINDVQLVRSVTEAFSRSISDPTQTAVIRNATYTYVTGSRVVCVAVLDDSKRFAETEAKLAGSIGSIGLKNQMVSRVISTDALYKEGAAPAVKLHRNERPSFEISVPDQAPGWMLKTRDIKEKPVFFVHSDQKSLPFIDVWIDFFEAVPADIRRQWQDSDKVLDFKRVSDIKFEKSVLPDVEFLKEEKMTLAGLPAFSRIKRSQKSGGSYHDIYVLFPEGIVSIALNSFTPSFEKDDKDFLAIIHTLKKQASTGHAPSQ